MNNERASSHRVGETGGLDDDVVELISSLQQRLQRRDKVVLDGAANATVIELEQVVRQDRAVGAILVKGWSKVGDQTKAPRQAYEQEKNNEIKAPSLSGIAVCGPELRVAGQCGSSHVTVSGDSRVI